MPPKPPIDILPAPFDWCYIPAGRVTLREDNFDGSYIAKGSTLARDVDPFWMARFPVTNAQFATFIDANGYDERRWWTTRGWQQKNTEAWKEPSFWWLSEYNGADYPVVGVTYHEAIAYCAWLAEAASVPIRLPEEYEWQWAAQGEESLVYPWGNRFDSTRCNAGLKKTTPVRRYEGRKAKGGDSPFGVTDMCGNAWEWNATLWGNHDERLNHEGARVLRGASWNYETDMPRATFRGLYHPDYTNGWIGFRICHSALT